MAEPETGASGGGSSVMFKVTSSLVVSGCETSWGEAFLPITEVSVRLQFSSQSKLGHLDTDNRFARLICVPERASLNPFAPP